MLKSDGFEVEVLAASWAYFDPESTVLTLRVRYPRIVLSELNTHRWLSRNSGSSRAIPTTTMLETVVKEPAMPVRFGGNKPGMQDTGQEHGELVRIPDFLRYAYDDFIHGDNFGEDTYSVDARTFWRFMAWVNAEASRSYSDAGYHKQIANRLTEPYQWMNTILTATNRGWDAFLKLRDHEAADPTIAKLAGLIRLARDTADFKCLQKGEWHLPYVLPEESNLWMDEKLVLSTARLARVSVKPFDGNADYEAEQKRHDLLVNANPMHASPTEHPCTPMPGRYGNFENFLQYRQLLEEQ